MFVYDNVNDTTHDADFLTCGTLLLYKWKTITREKILPGLHYHVLPANRTY